MAFGLFQLLEILTVPVPDVNTTAASVIISVVFMGVLMGKEITAVSPNVNEQVEDTLNAALWPTAFGFLTVILIQLSEII